MILPGACYVEFALEAAIKGTRPEPKIIKDLKFNNILPLHDHLVRTVECTKETSGQDEWYNFTISHVTDQGDKILSSAIIGSFESNGNEEVFTLSEACTFLDLSQKYFLF